MRYPHPLPNRMDWICDKVRGKTVLDIGGATGELHKRMKKIAKSVIGIDDFTDVLASKIHSDIIKANAETFCKGKYERIILGNCLEHMDNPGLALDNAYRMLLPNGQLIVTTPNLRYYQVWAKDRLSCRHFQGWTVKLMRTLMVRHGFYVVRAEFFRMDGKFAVSGRAYNILCRFLPQFAAHFGVVAIKMGLQNERRKK